MTRTTSPRQNAKPLPPSAKTNKTSTDEGGAVVIMNKDLYIAEGLRQLQNPKYYKEIHTSSVSHTTSKIHSII